MALAEPATSRETNFLIARYCGSQHGVVAMFQLTTAGVSKDAVVARARSGWLTAIHDGVYATSPRQLTVWGRAMAAVLAAGPDACLSHQSAAWLWKLDSARPVIHVVKRGGMNRELKPFDGYGKVIVHSTRRLDPCEVTEVNGIPVTSFIRTTIDLAGGMTREALDDYLADADRENLLRLKELERELDRWTGKKGITRLRRTLGDWHPSTEEEMLIFQKEFVGALVRAGAPRPRVDPLLDGCLIDLLWEEYMLMFELDGHAFHRDPAMQTKDARRDRKHTLMGYQVNRFTRQEFRDNRAEVIGQALQLLRSRGWRGPDPQPLHQGVYRSLEAPGPSDHI